LDNP